MAKSRSTINVLEVLQKANRILASDVGRAGGVDSSAHRMGVAMFLETILASTNNYAGFGYLPGFHPNGMGVSCDESRRHYYYSKRMRLAEVAKSKLERQLAEVGAS